MPNPRLFVEIAADSSKFTNALSGMSTGLQSAGDKMKSIGSNLTRSVTLPLFGIGAAATKAAIDWETAFTGVRKTVSATDDELAALESGLRELAINDVPVNLTELAGIAEAAGQLGIETENILDFTRVMAMLSTTASDLTAEDAAVALAQFANITQMNQGDFERLASTITLLGNSSATSEGKIVEMAQRLAGAGSIIGLTNAEIIGISAALSSLSIEAEAGGSAFSRVMSDMASAVAAGGKDLDAFAEVAGIASTDFAEAFGRDPASALIAFVEGLSRLDKEGTDVFAVLDKMGLGGIRVRDTLLRAANSGDLFRRSIQQGNQAWAENTALAAEAALRYETTEKKLQFLKNQLANFMVDLGGPFVDALTAALTAATPFLQLLSEWAAKFAAADPATQQMILAIGGLVAAAGPLLSILGTVISVVGTVAGVLSGPIVLAIAGAIAAIGLLWTAWKNNWGDIQGVTQTAVQGIIDVWNGTLWPALQRVGEWLKTTLFPILGDLGRVWLAGLRVELALLGIAFETMWAIGKTIAANLRTILGPAIEWITGLFANMGITVNGIRGTLGAAADFLGGIADKVNSLRGGGAAPPTSSAGLSRQTFAGRNGEPVVTRTGANNTINAPLIGTVNVRNDTDMQQIQQFMSDELRRSLGIVAQQNTRFPVGVGGG